MRGLDYYRHTAFEFVPEEGSAAADKLGAQSTILGGGRYDGLMETLGGPHTPSVGWAAGIERLAMLVGEREEEVAEAIIVVEDDSDEAMRKASNALASLRDHGLSAEMIATGSARKRYDKAVKRSPRAIITLSSDGHGLSGDHDSNARIVEILPYLK